MSPHVSGLLVTPVKSLRIQRRDTVTLERGGVPENRRFFIIDGEDRMVNGNRLTTLQAVVAEYSHRERKLTLHFPDGRTVTGHPTSGPLIAAHFHGSAVPAVALSDVAATSTGGQIIAAGGIDSAGVAAATIYSITVRQG